MDRTGFSKKSVIETISFEFISGLSRRLFEPHRTDWMVFPYTVIVRAFDSAYICEISNEGTYAISPEEALLVPGYYSTGCFLKNGDF